MAKYSTSVCITSAVLPVCTNKLKKKEVHCVLAQRNNNKYIFGIEVWNAD